MSLNIQTAETKDFDPQQGAEPNTLVQLALGGCSQSYSELATRFYPKLVHLIQGRLYGGSHMDAEDIAQEALTRSFQNLDAFDPSYRFSTWLYTIAFRIAADHNRGRRRRLRLVETHQAIIAEKSGVNSVPTSPLEQREEVDSIWLVARQVLNPTQYTVVWLRFGEDLAVAEIAKVMRKTKVGVRVALHRARTKLMTELSKEESQIPHHQMARSEREV